MDPGQSSGLRRTGGLLTPAEKKKNRDAHRKRKGRPQKKRLYLLFDPTHKAFKGWEDVQGIWKMGSCEKFIEFCHINKYFPFAMHEVHRHNSYVSLSHCLCEEYKERCIQVFQHINDLAKIPSNRVGLSIARMVYAEVALKKVVDWRTLRVGKGSPRPTTRDIPRNRKYPKGGLGKLVHDPPTPDLLVTWSSSSSEDEHTEWTPQTRARATRPVVPDDPELAEALNAIATNDEWGPIGEGGEGGDHNDEPHREGKQEDEGSENDESDEANDAEYDLEMERAFRISAESRIKELERELQIRDLEKAALAMDVESLQAKLEAKDKIIAAYKEKGEKRKRG